MNLQGEIWVKARAASMPLICALLITYFGYHAVHGKYGLIAWSDVADELVRLDAEHADIVAERKALEAHATYLRQDKLDPDLLDEQARRALGFVGENEIIIERPQSAQ